MRRFSPTTLEEITSEVLKLCRTGRFADALSVIEELKKYPHDELTAEKRAEIDLTTGIVIGFADELAGLQNPQEEARDFLFRALQFFEQKPVPEKIVSCQAAIAASFSRQGKMLEARRFVNLALISEVDDGHPEKLYAVLVEAVIDISEQLYRRVLTVLRAKRKLFALSGDTFLSACFYNHCGTASKNLGYISASIEYFSKSKELLQQLEHFPYLAATENNLAQLYRSIGESEKAFTAASKARKFYRLVGQKKNEAFVTDTLAGLLFDRHQFSKALKFARFAVEHLRQLDKKDFLLSALETKIKILTALDRLPEALELTIEAESLGRKVFGESGASRALRGTSEAIENIISEPRRLAALCKEDWICEIPEILNENLFGVLLKSERLSDFGIRESEMAIICQKEVIDGELVGILENNLVYFGFLARFAGMIALELGEQKTYIFDEKNVQILGEVVGKVAAPLIGDHRIVKVPRLTIKFYLP